MAHSTYTTTQTGQDRVLKGDRQALSSSGRAGQGRVLRESGAGWRPLTSLALLSQPGGPAAENYLLTTAPLSLVPSSRVLVASLLLANQAQDIHLAANSGPHYHFCTNVIIANLVALPTLSSH